MGLFDFALTLSKIILISLVMFSHTTPFFSVVSTGWFTLTNSRCTHIQILKHLWLLLPPVLKYRAGMMPSLGSPYFELFRKSLDHTHMNVGKCCDERREKQRIVILRYMSCLMIWLECWFAIGFNRKCGVRSGWEHCSLHYCHRIGYIPVSLACIAGMFCRIIGDSRHFAIY